MSLETQVIVHIQYRTKSFLSIKVSSFLPQLDSNAIVAVVVPDPVKFPNIIEKELGKKAEHAELCRDPAVIKYMQGVITAHAETVRLEKFEVPKRIYLESEPWTPESGLVTAAFKLKRKPLEEKYKVGSSPRLSL